MRVEPGGLPGMVVFTPSPIADERGYFSRIFDAEIARGARLRLEPFVQDSQSRSRRGVIRELHVRSGPGEAKPVRCSHGAVFDVVVDVRPGSARFGTWVLLRLDDAEHRSVYVPGRACARLPGTHRSGRHLLPHRPAARPGIRPDHSLGRR
jgi:dTDP-4-dehydrorhamnose 3,5-epimerase